MVLYCSTDYSCFRFQYKRLPLRVRYKVILLSLGKMFFTRHVAGTSDRAVVNDIPPRYKHSSL